MGFRKALLSKPERYAVATRAVYGISDNNNNVLYPLNPKLLTKDLNTIAKLLQGQHYFAAHLMLQTLAGQLADASVMLDTLAQQCLEKSPVNDINW